MMLRLNDDERFGFDLYDLGPIEWITESTTDENIDVENGDDLDLYDTEED